MPEWVKVEITQQEAEALLKDQASRDEMEVLMAARALRSIGVALNKSKKKAA